MPMRLLTADALLRFLLELGLCFMTVDSVPPINNQSSTATVR